MVCWLTDVYNNDRDQAMKDNKGELQEEGLSFEDFIKQATRFFSQRQHEEGLKYMF